MNEISGWLTMLAAVCAIFLLYRNLGWFFMVALRIGRDGWPTLSPQINEPRATAQWRLRLETLCLCGQAMAIYFNAPVFATAGLTWMLGCRIVRFTDDRKQALWGIVLGGLSAAVAAATGGHL